MPYITILSFLLLLAHQMSLIWSLALHLFSKLSIILLFTGVLLLNPRVAKAPSEVMGKKHEEPASTDILVRLTPEEIGRAGISVQSVRRGEFRLYQDFPARVAANEREVADLTTWVRGRVADVFVDLGQEVRAGQVLAILDSSDLGLAQAAYLRARANLYVAERSYERAKSLLAEHIIATAEAQRCEEEMLSAQVEARELHDRLKLLGMEEGEIGRLERESKIHSQMPIKAPFAGRVIARDLTRGEVVETSERLFVIADLSRVWVLANIPEQDIAFIPPEQSLQAIDIEVRISTYPGEIFHAKITHVGDVLDQATRTIQLRLELPNPAHGLKPEMFGTIRISSVSEPDVLLVPASAIRRDRYRQFVFVQRDAKVFELREVRVKESNGEMVKVLQGLHEGERVVTQGAFSLKSEMLGEQT